MVMKLHHLALVALSVASALAADDESNLTLLDTQNPAIRDLAETAGESTAYDQLNDRNKPGVFYSEGLVDENTTFPGFHLLSKPETISSDWKPADFLYNGGLESVFTMNSANFYQPLPTQSIPWKIAGDKLGWSTFSSGFTVVDFKSQLLAPTLKTRIYKRFEFPKTPADLKYAPEGSGKDGAKTAFDYDRAMIDSSARKLVIVIHGWNPEADTDPYNSENWPALVENLHTEMLGKNSLANNWDLYAYRWGNDAYTGPKVGGGYNEDGELGIGLENGTQAAEIGFQHGLALGKLLRERGVPLEQVHFIAHSAGTWVARSASLYLNATKGSSSLVQQITLLDPYCPGAALADVSTGRFNGIYYDTGKLDTSALDTEKIKTWPEQVTCNRSENIYSKDTFVPGTNSEYDGRFLNVLVGEGMGIKNPTNSHLEDQWYGHGGPIRFYGFSVRPGAYVGESELNAWLAGPAKKAGWDQSLFMDEYRQTCPAFVNAGSIRILKVNPSSSARQAPGSATGIREILVDVDENAWVRAMLLPADGSAAELAGPVRLGDDGTFSIPRKKGGLLTGTFDKSVTPARLSLALNGVAFGQPTGLVSEAVGSHGVNVALNAAGNVVFSMSTVDGTVGMFVMKDTTGSGWEASGSGTVDGSGNFTVTGSNGFQTSGALAGLDGGGVTVHPPQVPEIHVENSSGKALPSGNALALPNTRIGKSSSPLAIKIRNTGTISLKGMAFTITGKNAKDFQVSGWTGKTLAPDASMSLGITFAPSSSGTRNATLTITSNDADEGTYVIPLQGAGTKPEIDVWSGTKALADGESTVMFGKVKTGSSAMRKFTIRNPGTATLNLGKITKTGKQAKDFTVSKPAATKLAPGASTTFTVTFNPSAKGLRNAAIHVASDDSNEGSFDILLTGTGKTLTKKSASLAAMVMEGLVADKAGLMRRPVTGNLLLDGKLYLTLTVEKSGLADRPVVEVSPNLLDWFSGARHTTVLQDDESWLRVRDNTPVTPEKKRFIRVKP